MLFLGVLLWTGRITAQTFTTLYSFTNVSGCLADLIVSGDTLYGTSFVGGNAGDGSVFSIKTDGSGFTVLRSFLGVNYNDPAEPAGSVLLLNDTLFGTTEIGGSPGNVGTIFRINTNGTGFQTVRNFSAVSYPNNANADGADPVAGLALAGNTLYGTASGGGPVNFGTIFAVNTNGSSFTNLHSFTNVDGATPSAHLLLVSNVFYGTTKHGGAGANGTVFAIDPNPIAITNPPYGEVSTRYAFTNLYSFSPVTSFTNADGSNPYGGLVACGNTLFGTTRDGGIYGYGTIFRINTDGTGFTNLHSFSALSPGTSINSDGAYPESDLVLIGNRLYGTAQYGGVVGAGTVFSITTDGNDFTNIHNFDGASNDGTHPAAGLVASGYTLYGNTTLGGFWGKGTIFSISFLPPLSLTLSDTNSILAWPTNVGGFDCTGFILESCTNPGPSAIWTPVEFDGRSTVTNALSGDQQYFRLRRTMP